MKQKQICSQKYVPFCLRELSYYLAFKTTVMVEKIMGHKNKIENWLGIKYCTIINIFIYCFSNRYVIESSREMFQLILAFVQVASITSGSQQQ